MKIRFAIWSAALCVTLVVSGCKDTPSPQAAEASPREALVGVWRAQVRFAGGAFEPMKDLEFMYAYNAGGTLTESSNYDAAPPVPPAYGVWKKLGPRQFETKYVFYVTKPPAAFDEIAKGGGWTPAGHGVFTEQITLADDGKSYTSKIIYAQFDPSGKPAEGGGQGTAAGTRVDF
jgi:hypothetical protein